MKSVLLRCKSALRTRDYFTISIRNIETIQEIPKSLEYSNTVSENRSRRRNIAELPSFTKNYVIYALICEIRSENTFICFGNV